MKTKFKGFLTLLLAFVVQITFAQEKAVSGTVVDESNMPLPGATVLIQGTTTGTSTDFDGKYTINAKQGDVLTYSYVGYANQSVTVGSSNSINVNMAPDAESLNAVVVTALGIKRKSDEITTSNQVVKTEELTQANNPDVISGLSGKVSGLQINTVNNGVNSDTSIVLRGLRSISGDNSALIVVDGVISTANFLKTIDSDQIESFNVIKGANGAALYGERGSNGVIIVTTKTGNGSKDNQKVTIQVKSTVDFEEVAYVPERQTRYGQGWDLGNGFENITYENGGWGAELDGQLVPVGLPQADGSYIMSPYSSKGSDNIKEFFQTGTTFQNSISLSTGNADGYVNLGAKKQNTEFVIEGDVLDRISLNLNAGKKVNKWTVATNVRFSKTKTDEAYARNNSDGIYRQLLQTPVNVPVAQFENSGNEGHWNGYFFNPYWIRDNLRAENNRNRVTLGTTVQYDINDNINVLVRPNYRVSQRTYLDFQNGYQDPTSVTDIVGGAGRSLISQYRKFQTISKVFSNDIIANFDYDLTEDISFKANVGSNITANTFDYTGVGATNLLVAGLFQVDNGTFDQATTGNSFTESRTMGVYGNFDFGYKDYLFLNFTGRNDWVSVLEQGNHSYFYPSAGVSFIPTKAFPSLKNDVLNKAKLTASIVKVGGRGSVAAYSIQSLMNTGNGFPYTNGPSYISDQTITDPTIEPEFTNSLEFGINLDFFKGSRVTLDASYFSSETDNQIVNTTTSTTSGTTNNRINLSKTSGKGFEVDLGLTPVKTDDFEWKLRMSYATSKTTVDKISPDTDEVALGGFAGLASVFAVEGEQFPLIKGTAYERDDLGRVVIDAATGNPMQASELQILGNTTPDYILGLNTTFKYKNLKLGATLDYRTGHVFYSSTQSNLAWSGHLVESAQGGRGAFIFPNSSIETSPGVFTANTSVPTGGTTAGSLITYYSSYQNIAENSVIDATALKIREVSLSYSLSNNMLKNTPIESLVIGVNARNLFTFLPAENRGYGDPEFGFSSGNSQGISTTAQYPPTRTYGFSVNLTF